MEFRILGPLYADAGTGKGPALISQPLLQSALAVLLLRANRPCPRTMLIDALWGNEPPASPDAALRVCISRLRRCLGDCAARLESVGPPGGRAPGHRQQRGYTMTVRPGELDVDEFTDLLAQGQAELDTGNAAASAASLMHALALWGDPPLPDLPDTEAIAAAVARLKNQRQATVDALIDARLAAGEHEQVLGQLRVAVMANPGRERTCAQLMRAYHALGMRKEALDVYQIGRQATLEQQGAEPGPVLAVLYRQILAEEIATESPAAQLSAFAPAGLVLHGSQAPAPPADFTGRSEEIARIVDCLTGPGVPVAVVFGGPGTGKSTTAAASALQLRRRFSDGQLYAELGGVEQPRDPQDVLGDMLQTMGIPVRGVPTAGPARTAMYRSLLAGRKVLVIADDAATAAQVRALIPAAGGAAVLVTSRSRLSGLAGANRVELDGLPDSDALALLGSIAGPGRIAAELTAAGAVIKACAGLPLAVAIAGATLAARPGLTVARLASECAGGDVLEVLTVDDSSVRAAIASSYRAIPASARAALATAAITLPGEVPAWALTELADGDSAVPDKLAGAGLLAPARAEISGRRYRIHPLTRAFAAEYGREQGAYHDQALSRLRAGFLYRADRAAARVPAVPFLCLPPAGSAPQATGLDPEAGSAWLDCERASLLALAEHACAAGNHQAALALASRLLANECIKGAYADGISVWRTISASAAAAGDTSVQTTSAYYLAVMLADSHDHASAAAELLASCVPALEQAGELPAAAMGYALMGRCASADGRHAAAIRAARRAVKLAGEGPGSELVRCCATTVLGLTLARVGIAGRGIDLCMQALVEARTLREPAYEAHAMRTLAQALILSGQHAAAASICRDGVRLARGYGSEITAARFMLMLGRACQCDHDPKAAEDTLRIAAEIFGHAGLVVEEMTARSMLASCNKSRGDNRQAAAHVHDVTQILGHRGIGDAGPKAAAAQAASELASEQTATTYGTRLIAG
jgi:DNA-binding SARP family transcriptional activator/tetratricopeptide (TPR) repeat protein